MKINFIEDRKPVLAHNAFDGESEYWAKFRGDSTDNLNPNKKSTASKDPNNPQVMTTVKHNIIAYFVEDKLPTATVLDIGCGVGRMSLFYKIGSYWGIDTTPAMISKAKKLNKKNTSTFILGDGTTLKQFTNNKFDYVFCSTVMLHLKIGTVRRYAKEVYRVLKEHGAFIVNFPNKSNLKLIESIFSKHFNIYILDSNYCGTDTVYNFVKRKNHE